jgi:hypothetical protein
MDLSVLLSAISNAINEEEARGFHVMSITIARKLGYYNSDITFTYGELLQYSSDLKLNEFCISFRSSPSERHVNFYRVSHASRTPAA